MQAVEPHDFTRPPVRQAAHRQLRQQHARQRRDRREQQRFGEELSDNPAAVRTEGRPDRELVLARRAARQQQVGDIDARNQEHGKHGSGEQADRRPHIANQMFANGNDRGAHAFVRAWILGLDLRPTGVHLRLRRAEAHAVFQAADDLPIATGRALCLVPLHRPGGPQPDAARLVFEQARLKFIGRDADDDVGERVEGNGLADDCRIGAEVAAPDARAQDHDLVVALLVFVLEEETAQERLDAEGVEEALGHVDGAPHFGPIAAGVVVAPRIPGGEMREALRTRPPVKEVGRRDLQPRGRGQLPLPDGNQAFVVRVGQRPLQDLRDDAERDHRRRHAESEDGDRGEREPAVLPHLPPAVTQIVDGLQIRHVALTNPEGINE